MKPEDDTNARMTVRGALAVLAELRDDKTIVVTNQGSARVWPLITNHSLDFHYNPSTMGGAIPFGLGLALANPLLHVIVISGDGALTMSLGSLVSVIATGATNVTVVVLDNGIYEVTGGQKTAANMAGVDYVALAGSVGFHAAFGFDRETIWREEGRTVMGAPGPRFVALRVEKALPEDMATPALPIADQISRLTKAIQSR